MYGSASYPAPNSALNDFQLELECTQSTSGADDCTCKNTFVPGPSQRESLHRQHYDGKVRRQAVATAGLFITVEGRGSGNNEFVVSITDGDSPTDCVGLEVADNCEDNTTTSTPPQSRWNEGGRGGFKTSCNLILIRLYTVCYYYTNINLAVSYSSLVFIILTRLGWPTLFTAMVAYFLVLSCS